MFNNLIYNVINVIKSPTTLNLANKVGYIPHYNQILPNLYLGNLHASQDEEFLRTSKIDAIVNCTVNEPFHPYFVNYPVYRCNVEDSKTDENIELFKNKLYSTVAFIEHHISKGRIVFVHCYWGLMRSATVVAAYLIKTKQMSHIEAIQFVKSKRPKALSSIYNYNKLLEDFSKNISSFN